jgi:alkylated DNA repair dioxygenase AlkB
VRTRTTANHSDSICQRILLPHLIVISATSQTNVQLQPTTNVLMACCRRLPRQRSRPTLGLSGTTNLGEGAEIVYLPAFIPSVEASRLFHRLHQEVPWEQREITVFGRRVLQPRLITYFGDDPQLKYTYSQQTLSPLPWHAAASEIRRRVQPLAGDHVGFNSCLLNLYRDGKDSLSWHSDSEAEYGEHPTILSVSLGAPRDFLLRRNSDHADKLCYKLSAGDVIIMRGAVQHHWMHSVPKRVSKEARINLTFRTILRQSG